MHSAIDKIGHVVGRLDCERMMGEAWPGRNIIRHIARHLALPVRTFRQYSDHQVLKRDHADAELYEFGV